MTHQLPLTVDIPHGVPRTTSIQAMEPSDQSSPGHPYEQPGQSKSPLSHPDKLSDEDLNFETLLSPTDSRNTPSDSLSKRMPRALFSGPPPPIAASALLSRPPPTPSSYSSSSNHRPWSLLRMIEKSVSQVMMDRSQPEDAAAYERPDPLWRDMRRRERSIEVKIQQLLDCQAEGLIPNRKAAGIFPAENSDAQLRINPSNVRTGTLSMDASVSHVSKSLEIMPRFTSVGNLIPVRQPAEAEPFKLQAARVGLIEAIESLIKLRCEEIDHMDQMLNAREAALRQLDGLTTKRLEIQSRLEAFEEDAEEPLARELRDLERTYTAVGREIDNLEMNLKDLQNQQRWLFDQIREVRCKRDAGLSGYRGALSVVDDKLRRLVRLPNIPPLDPALRSRSDDMLRDDHRISEGSGFLSLLPDHRGAETSRTCWNSEVRTLRRRRAWLVDDRLALQEGRNVWEQALGTICEFESNLRGMVKRDISAPGDKQKSLPDDEILQSQTENMNGVLDQLEHALDLAESRGWKLLICALGAELEAFTEARWMLGELSSNAISDQHADTMNPPQNRRSTIMGINASSRDTQNPAPEDLLDSRID